MSTAPVALTSHHSPDSIIAYRPAGPVKVADFIAAAHQVAALLPDGAAMLNFCEDRYRFMVGLAAGMLAGKNSLLPASTTPETLRQLRSQAPDLFILHDGKSPAGDLPAIEYPAQAAPPSAGGAVPCLAHDRVAATLFTSGSTGTPMPHAKTWGRMARSGRAEAGRLGLLARGHAIVATVPAQHSYGLESSILLALHGNCSLWSGRPFYPADIAAALEAVPRPRLLVTTPYHLRALMSSGVDIPPLDMVLSATAPLSQALAAEVEDQLGAPLLEIYGCTETGQLASRHTRDTTTWQLFPGVRLVLEDDIAYASGGHVERRLPLSDVIEPCDEHHFLLHGRHADMINIAGKRTSLAYLNQQLLAVDGVRDGCFFLPDEHAAATVEDITRLCAFAVAPGLTKRALTDALRERIDSIFLPRPLIMVESLPRNAAHKLPREALQALYDQQMKAGKP